MWEQLRELFQGSTANYGATDLTGDVKENGKKDARSYTVAGQIPDNVWKDHFAGKWPSIGVIPLGDDDRTIRFAAIDIDVYRDVDFQSIENKLAAKSIPGLMTKSKSGGVHIWFFFSKPVAAKPIIAKLAQIAAYLGFGNAERFPPTGERLQKHDVGSWINIPFHGSQRQGYVRGKAVPFKQFYAVAKKKLIKNQAKFLSLDTGLDSESTFADGPPCLQRLDQEGLPEGIRNVALFQFALYFRSKYQAEYQRPLFEYNTSLDDPLPSAEIQRIATAVDKSETYFYGCSKEPLCSRCDRKLCMSRPFGIGEMQGAPLSGVTVGDITQLLTDPPIIIVDLNDVRIQLKEGFRTFLSQAAMRTVCADHIDMYPPKVGAKQWDEFVHELVQRKNKVDVPEDATPTGRFREHVKDFITKRMSKDRDQLLNSGVWIDEDDQFNLRLLDLTQYLKREGFMSMGEPEIVAALKGLDAKSLRLTVKGRDIHVWIVSPGTIQIQDYETKSFEPNY